MIIPRLGLVYTRHHGRVDVPSMRDAFLRSTSSDAFRPGMKRLVDMSDVTEVDIDFNAMMRRAQDVQQYFDRLQVWTRMCLFAPNALSYGMARMFQTLAEADGSRLTVSVVDNAADVATFLEIPEEDIAHLLDGSAPEKLATGGQG
ncbi:hypothetical protein [Pseudoruegeria sp. HB172150]|uniref:hypothetical protein n=1 Tax=Pseudoruegeria sp. HB172150 TaxID=2721164 RepID=UPI001556FA0C|nr:hypothetical protein [Pseudoruegeria sp. HB172150]